MVHSAGRSQVDVGAVIAGTYTIERLLGRGGMGAVFLASHARLPGKKVAIKVLHPDVADSESLARFRREAEIASRLGHANIVEVHDWNTLPDGTPYLVLEFLEGESLAQRLARGPMPLVETLQIVRQVGSALSAAHREEIIHRDLKPQNVFLVPVETDDGTPAVRAKVLDFGISKIRGSQTIKTQDTSILGTPQYMAPEQALGHHGAVDARTDVFALGAMVYEMLCGAPAFGGSSVPEVVFKVVYEQPPPIGERVAMLPPNVAAAVTKALEKKAADRFQDVPSFVEALTGQPLISGKRPLAIAPGDGTTPSAETSAQKQSDKITNKEAFAHTVGSGDHARAVSAPGIATDATIASGSHTPPVKAAEPPATIPTVTTPAKGRGGLVITAVAIVAAAAVAIAFAVTRGGGGGGGGAGTGAVAAGGAPSVDAAAAPAAAVDAAPAAATAIDAAAAPAAAVDAGTKKPPPDAAVKKPKPDAAPTPDEPDEPADDEDAGIKDCRTLLSSGDPDEALVCANKILEKKPGAAHAHVIRASAYCDLEDQEKALSALRKIGKRPRLRRTVIAYCAKRGITLQ
jgi:serine/threonine protein kinase